MKEILTNFLQIPQQWSPDTLLPTNPLSDEVWGFISEWSRRNMMKFHIINGLPEWISLFMLIFYANYLFDNLPLQHLTHLQHVDCFYRLDAVVNCEIEPGCSVKEKKKKNPKKQAANLVVVFQWKVSTRESSWLSGNETITVFSIIWFVFLRTGMSWLEKPPGNCENSEH